MSILDEQALSRRLHEDLDAVPAPAAPVGAVLRPRRSIRARRRAAAASAALMAGAAAVAIAVSAQPGNPAARPAAGAARTGGAPAHSRARQHPAACPRSCSTAPTACCCRARPLSARPSSAPRSWITRPASPGAGYAALQVAPAVTRLTAVFRNRTTLTVHPVPLRACGQQLHLAGFAYPVSGVARITADSGGPFASTAREILPASLFQGAACSGGRPG